MKGGNDQVLFDTRCNWRCTTKRLAAVYLRKRGPRRQACRKVAIVHIGIILCTLLSARLAGARHILYRLSKLGIVQTAKFKYLLFRKRANVWPEFVCFRSVAVWKIPRDPLVARWRQFGRRKSIDRSWITLEPRANDRQVLLVFGNDFIVVSTSRRDLIPHHYPFAFLVFHLSTENKTVGPVSESRKLLEVSSFSSDAQAHL